VSRTLVERRLREVADRLRKQREELRVVDEQLAALAAEADDTRLRALVSETPLADREHQEARRHADAMARHRAEVAASIVQLEVRQDDLLDRLMAFR
jgi:hypothetical protein